MLKFHQSIKQKEEGCKTRKDVKKMNKKKKIAVLLITIFVALMAFANKSSAITKAELEEYMTTEKDFGGTKLVIRDTDKVKLERFFKSHNMTDEQATKIQGIIEKAVKFMNDDGAKSPNKVSTKVKKKELFSYAEEAARVLGLSVTYDASEERLDIYENGKFYDSLYWGVEKKTGLVTTEPKYKKTGATYNGYVAAAGVMIIAGITFVFVKRRTLKA